MKKVAALTVFVMLMAAFALAQTPGYVPVFTNASGNVANSLMFQSGANVGIATMSPDARFTVNGNAAALTPIANAVLHFANADGSPSVVGIDSFGAINTITFRRADGTGAVPTALQNGDVIGQYGWLGRGATGYQTGAAAQIAAGAAETWTDSTGAGYLAFKTRPSGTTGAPTERLRIISTGNVGIGTTTPGQKLEVNGSIKLSQNSGGTLIFADNSVQTTAAVPVVFTSPDGSLAVGGTAAAPTISVNPAAIGAGGTLVSVPVIVAQTSFTGSYGLGTVNPIYTANQDAFYRVSVYMNVGTTGTCGTAPCAGEAITVQWNDGVSTTALATANCNLVTPCSSSVVTPVWVKSGQAITAYGQNYGAGTAPTGGSYNAYVLVEMLKK